MNTLKLTAGVLGLCFVITACISKPFQPLPPLFKTWAKEGSTADDVKAALLSCGYDNPYTGFNQYVSPNVERQVSIDDRARAGRCMKDNGFNYSLAGGKTICDIEQWVNLPACVEKKYFNKEWRQDKK